MELRMEDTTYTLRLLIKLDGRASTVYREFIYDTQEPEVIGAGPIDLSQPVSYMSQSLTQFNFTVVDVGPADLELSNQEVTHPRCKWR